MEGSKFFRYLDPSSSEESSKEHSERSSSDSAGSTRQSSSLNIVHDNVTVETPEDHRLTASPPVDSSEESSREDYSLRSERSFSGCAGSTRQSVNILHDNVTLQMTSEEHKLPVSPLVDPTSDGCLSEMYYSVQGYLHHRHAIKYAADDNFTAAFREWKLARLYKYSRAFYYIGNCYNQGKGVQKNFIKVFHQSSRTCCV